MLILLNDQARVTNPDIKKPANHLEKLITSFKNNNLLILLTEIVLHIMVKLSDRPSHIVIQHGC